MDTVTGIISTVVGNGLPIPVSSPLPAPGSAIGDSGLATDAFINFPTGVIVDSPGNIFFVDIGNSRIRKVDGITGIINTVAGNGKFGFSGDGGQATEAQLNRPSCLSVDSSGNIFIADINNNRIRKVDGITGVISTVAGNEAVGFRGDGVTATETSLNQPYGVFVDSLGNIFISDSGNNRIRKVDGITGIISTVAGNGAGGFSDDGVPATTAALGDLTGVFVDSLGNIFFAENNRIRKVDRATGMISTVAGNDTTGFSGDGVTATATALNDPRCVFVDSSGNIFIADNFNDRIRKVHLVTLFADFTSDKQTGTVPLTVNFTDQSIGTIDTWLWDFGDGSTSSEQNPTHTYLAEGSFDVSLTVSFEGNSNTERKDGFITTTLPPVGTVPIANFIADQTLGPPPLDVQFTDLSTGDPTGWLWEFGDGSASIEQNAAHTYRVEGMFTVTLTVSNSPGSDSLTRNDLINITPQSGKSFTFNCENSMKRGPFLELEKLNMKLGDSENCTLKLTNHEPGKRIEVSSLLRKGFWSAIKIEPARSVTDENGVLEITITAARKGRDWAAWAVPNDRGQFEFNKKTYDTGLAWGMFVEVK